MRHRVAVALLSVAVSGTASLLLWKAMPVRAASASTAAWNHQAAARYLDDREVWWQQWPRAQRDHGTICISCHTVVPYAMARPALRRDLGETSVTPSEKIMLDNVEKRVSHWSEMEPFYSDEKYGAGKAVESHSTEAVLNAVLLASYDPLQGPMRPITRAAFDEAWALQESTGDLAGGWKWQEFHLGPWESSESGYQGATLLMIQALDAPDGYAKEPEVRKHLERERDYLRRNYASQPLLNQLFVLWASAKDPGLIPAAEQKSLLAAVESQQQADGGWRTTSLDKRERVDHSPEPAEGDGYATAVAVLAMEHARAGGDALRRGVAWLTQNQQKDGSWTAASINKKRDPQSDAALFMTDAASAYAALALEQSGRAGLAVSRK